MNALNLLGPLGQLVGQLAGIVAKAIADKNATHEAIVADVERAIGEFRTGLALLDASTAAARAKTDAAEAAALERLAAAGVKPSITLPVDLGP